MHAEESRPDRPGPTVYFDGVCNLCNGLVTFVIPRDRLGTIRFVSLQSELGQRTLEQAGMDNRNLETILFRDQDRLLTKSTAVLRMLRYLKKPWSFGAVLLILPRPIRDWCYDFVAARRYRWFGRRDSCLMPTPELRDRFLS
ncbi:MAG TPA: thiol-disulfide oxidoreductase DCC family protein [Phycisphaerales bacterium]|nr:thiol-disulfide oxidoreductase DCC family protein [Phycisphaerales bacterium]